MGDVLKAAGIAAAVYLALVVFGVVIALVSTYLGALGVGLLFTFLVVFGTVYMGILESKPYDYNPKVPN